MTPKTRPVSWIGAALKEFETFPEGARSICLAALTVAAEGGKADIVKPMRGMGSEVFEIALPFRGDAYRVVYAVQMAEEIWVVHAFQKKSTQGDRKSTRLNSSHANISYAVFCLKKKKNEVSAVLNHRDFMATQRDQRCCCV